MILLRDSKQIIGRMNCYAVNAVAVGAAIIKLGQFPPVFDISQLHSATPYTDNQYWHRSIETTRAYYART